MADALEALSRELLDRLTTEESRSSDTAGTHLVGGIVKAGARLEALLREVVQTVAAADGVDPALLLSPTGGRPLTLRKAMAGPLAHGLRDYVGRRRGKALPRHLEPILRDLAARRSRILAFISTRNRVAKEGGEPRNARATMADLRLLITELRVACGFEVTR